MNYASINSKREHPPGNLQGFAPTFSPGAGIYTNLNFPGVGPIIFNQSTKLSVDAA